MKPSELQKALDARLMKRLEPLGWEYRSGEIRFRCDNGDCFKYGVAPLARAYLSCYPTAYLHVAKVMQAAARIEGERYRSCDGTTAFVEIKDLMETGGEEIIRLYSVSDIERNVDKMAEELLESGVPWMQKMRSPETLAKFAMSGQSPPLMPDALVRTLAIFLGGFPREASEFLDMHLEKNRRGTGGVDILEYEPALKEFLSNPQGS
ncbi:MAG: hypothetical protein U0R49_00190 [Fimbriimonadales bacterium]